MGGELNGTRQIYDRLWSETFAALARNDLEFDPYLLNKEQDLRRGLTLLFRPSPAVQNFISAFLHQLAEVASGQYFYRPEEFHITVLAIIPGSESWEDKIQHLPAYQTIIEEVLKRHRKFSIEFRGVTASRGGVMIQGFPKDNTLAEIRDDLREAMRQNNFGGQLDVRYKINTAHITVMRFCNATANWNNVLAMLQANRMTDFGEARVANLELILGDWYASTETARVIQKYPL